MNTDFQNELHFLTLAENLKKEVRHSWLSDGRRESVAEHCWRLTLMAWRFAHRLTQPVNLEKCLKLAVIHDLPEAKTGDTPVFHKHHPQGKSEKYQREATAMQEITNMLGDMQSEEMLQLWYEYEEQKSYESKFIKALDKLEAFIQHNEASLSTWEECEKRMVFQQKWLKQHCQFDPFIAQLAEAVMQQSVNKLAATQEDLEAIKASAAAEELTWQKEGI